MTDIFDSITSALRDRLVSPLAGSFITSWLVVNYKVIVVLLSDMKPYVKFSFISNHIWTDWFVTSVYCLALPLAASLAYTLIYPWPARWVLQASLWHQMRTKKAQLDGEGRIPLSREDIDRLKQKWSEKFNKQGEDVQRLEAQLEDLQKREESTRTAEQVMTSRANELAQELQKLKIDSTASIDNITKLQERNRMYKDENQKLKDNLIQLQERIDSLLSASEGHEPVGSKTNRKGASKFRSQYYTINNASGDDKRKVVTKSEVYQFLSEFMDAAGFRAEINDQMFLTLQEVMSRLPTEQADSLLAQIKSGDVDISSMPARLVDIISATILSSK
ncbi:hypothetical protein ACSC9U_05035 [Pseudomonas solani]|uniref:hypothetical protein n=1 Tax=Pseudomonas solani TaxID=2731552 RepID=UPI003F4AA9F4